MILVVFFFKKILDFSRMRSRGGAECRKGCQGIPINLHMLKAGEEKRTEEIQRQQQHSFAVFILQKNRR